MRSTWRGVESVLRLGPAEHRGTVPSNIASLLAQPWSHLDDGTNMWVFQAPSVPYVLKLIKDPGAIAEAMTSWGEETPADELRETLAQQHISQELRGAALAWKLARHETGLIWADTRGSARVVIELAGERIPLGGVPFLVQERGVSVRDHLVDLLAAQNADERAIALFEEMVQLVVTLMRRGLADTDCYFRGNFVTVGDRLIQVDTGGLVFGEDAVRAELTRRRIVTHPTFRKLQGEHPAWAGHLAAVVERRFTQLERLPTIVGARTTAQPATDTEGLLAADPSGQPRREALDRRGSPDRQPRL